MWGRMMLVVALAASVVAASAGCGPASESASESTSPPTSMASASALPIADGDPSGGSEDPAAGTQFLRLIARLVYAGKTWTYEPRGDVPDSGAVAGTLVFARISSVSDDGDKITFDAVQVAFGDEQARALSGLPGARLNPNAPVCVRNAHVHKQTATLVSDCPAAFVAGLGGSLQAVAPAQVAAFGYCWLVLDEGKVAAILGQPMY
jgi:hypothetical protein